MGWLSVLCYFLFSFLVNNHCISQDVFQQRYQEMLSNGDFVKLLKEKILEDLEGESFDCCNPEPFDRLYFEVTESKGD